MTADAAPAPIAAPIVVLPQAQASVAAPVQPDASAPVPAGPPVAPVQDPLAQTGHPAPSPGPDASQTPAADTAPLPAAPIQAQPKPDALAGSLKAARKALTNDIDAQTIHTATPRNAAPSGFSLQPQADTQGSYTATGAQSGGMTQGGSNLARATVETLSTMSVQITRKLSEGNTKFAVELHPADLGKVEVTLSIARDGTTTAHLKFDTPVTAAAFQAQEGELRHQLAQSGLNLDGGALTFSSRDGGSAGGFGQSFAQMQQQNQPQDQSQSRQSQARAFQNAAAIADAADSSAAVDAGLLALRAGVSSTLALNLIV
ncbi:MAG: flagellar hook-length control protein FliK [Asticcacaulis sp.]|nr:flagellar hook-length control protein FliK [Asticcacaulis sp.]